MALLEPVSATSDEDEARAIEREGDGRGSLIVARFNDAGMLPLLLFSLSLSRETSELHGDG